MEAAEAASSAKGRTLSRPPAPLSLMVVATVGATKAATTALVVVSTAASLVAVVVENSAVVVVAMVIEAAIGPTPSARPRKDLRTMRRKTGSARKTRKSGTRKLGLSGTSTVDGSSAATLVEKCELAAAKSSSRMPRPSPPGPPRTRRFRKNTH